MRTTTSMTLVLIALLLTAAPAGAQTAEPRPTFVSVNVGAQAQSRDVEAGFRVPVYAQDAVGTTVQTVGRGAIFDISAGQRVWSNLGIAVGFSTFTNEHDISGTASIPHPTFFNRPATVGLSAVDAKRSERNVYILATWYRPVTEEMDVVLSIGPSFTRVHQDLITGVDVPFPTQNASPVVEERSGWGSGVNFGVDGTYLLTPSYGVGLFLRYNRTSFELAENETDLATGGFQIGAGVRLRF